MQTNKDTTVAFETALKTSAYLILEHVNVAMALLDAHTSRLLAANPSFDALLPIRWRNGEALGHSLAELLPPDISHRYIKCFQQVIKTGTACHIEAPDSFMSTEKTTSWQWVLDPITEKGQVYAVVLTVRDVTAQLQAEQRASQAQLALAQERQQRDLLETLLRNIQGLSEPKAVAQAILKVLAPVFPSSLLALYHTRFSWPLTDQTTFHSISLLLHALRHTLMEQLLLKRCNNTPRC
jgi:PAS domain S-box-containing protein